MSSMEHEGPGEGDQLMADDTLRPGRFYIEVYGDDLFEGWTDGTDWNGWATPLFEYGQALAVMNRHNQMEPLVDPEDRPQAWYDAEKDEFCFITEGTEREVEHYPAVTREIGGRQAKLYGIGSWYWTWDEAVEDHAAV